MQEQSKLEETVDNIKEYMNTRYELAVLKTSDKIAHVGSGFFSFLPVIFLTVLTIIMLSFGLAFYLNVELESQYTGFLLVGGGYFVIGFLLICVRKKLLAKPIRNKIIRELFKNNALD